MTDTEQSPANLKDLQEKQKEEQEKFQQLINQAITQEKGEKLNGLEATALAGALSNILFGIFLTLKQMGMNEDQILMMCQNLHAATAEALNSEEVMH